MAHFAELDENDIVIRVLVVDNDQENRGQEFLSEDLGLGGKWMQTSYNTRGGIHYNLETGEPSLDQSKAFRKNFAGIDYYYDEQRDAFIPPQPYPSWTLEENSCTWIPPVPRPESNGNYVWNEELGEWQKLSFE